MQLRMRTQNKPWELQELLHRWLHRMVHRSLAALAITRNIWLYKWDNNRTICKTRCWYSIWQKTLWPSGSTLEQSNFKCQSRCWPISNRSSQAWRDLLPTNQRYATRKKQWQSLSKKIQRVRQQHNLNPTRKIAWWTILNKACRFRMLVRAERRW